MTSLLFTNDARVLPDRRAAGRRLATRVAGYAEAHPVVVGVAPDAMPIAAEIAHALSAPLETVAIAPLGLGPEAPAAHEAPPPADRFGVAAEGGIVFYEPDHRAEVEAAPEAVDAALVETEAHLQQLTTLWHGGRHRQSLNGRTVLLVAELLVDEQLAAAAACAVRDRGAAHVVYVAARARLATVLAVEDWIDEVVGLELIDDTASPADCFRDSPPVSDAMVRRLLEENRTERRAGRHQ